MKISRTMIAVAVCCVIVGAPVAALASKAAPPKLHAGRWKLINEEPGDAAGLSGSFGVIKGNKPAIRNFSTTITSAADTACGTGSITLRGKLALKYYKHDTWVTPGGLTKTRTIFHNGKKVRGKLTFSLVAPKGGHNKYYTSGGQIQYDHQECILSFAVKFS